MSEFLQAFWERYAKVYGPEANEKATEEKRLEEERRAKQRKMYPPSRPPRSTY